MKYLINKLKTMKIGKNTVIFLSLILIGAVMYYLLAEVIGPFAPMSSFPAAVLKMTLVVAAWMYFDDIHFSEIDSVYEIQKGNTAYSIVLLAIAILIASVILSV